jgi:hypothetical protein
MERSAAQEMWGKKCGRSSLPRTTERKYQIAWRGGNGIDTITLSQDGKKLAGKARDGFKFAAERVE